MRRVDLTEFTDSSENEGRSHVRMTGKRDLARRSENSDVTRVAGICRKNERALGEIKLARDLLHLIRREPFGLWQNSQLIPAEASLRKHVADVISVFHILVFQRRLLLLVIARSGSEGRGLLPRGPWQILDTRCLMLDEGNIALIRCAPATP